MHCWCNVTRVMFRRAYKPINQSMRHLLCCRWLLACAKSGNLEPVENYLIDNEPEMANKVSTSTGSLASGDKQIDLLPTEAGSDTVNQNKDLKDLKESAAEHERSQINAKNIGSAQSNDIQAADRSLGKQTSANVENHLVTADNSRGIAVSETSGMKGPDFSTTGDTEALLLGLNTQGEQISINQEINLIEENGNSAVNKNQSVSNEESRPKSVQTVTQDNSAGKGSDLSCMDKDTKASPATETATIIGDNRCSGFASAGI